MILTVTYNPAVDVTVRVDDPLRPGTVARARDVRYDAGGKGINVSQVVRALDGDTVAAGLLGGFTGEHLRESLAAEDLPTEFVDVDAPTRLNTTALAADGEYKLNQPGPAVSASAVDELVERVSGYDPTFVHVAGSLPPGLDALAVDAVASAGSWETTVDVPGDVLAGLDGSYALCTPNRDELRAATGGAVSSVADCVSAARELRDRGFGAVLASLGDEGALLVTDDGALHAESLDVDVVDTVGAGDALVAGYLAARDDGESPADALRTGTAAASRVVGRAGTAVPAFDDLRATRDEVTVRRP